MSRYSNPYRQHYAAGDPSAPEMPERYLDQAAAELLESLCEDDDGSSGLTPQEVRAGHQFTIDQGHYADRIMDIALGLVDADLEDRACADAEAAQERQAEERDRWADRWANEAPCRDNRGDR